MFKSFLTSFAANCGDVETALIDCSAGGTGGIRTILQLIIDILTGAIAIVALIGILISGVQYMTGKGNEQTTTKAKRRIFNIVLGLACYVSIYGIATWLLPNLSSSSLSINSVTINFPNNNTATIGSSVYPTVTIDGSDTTYSLITNDKSIVAVSSNSVRCISAGEAEIIAVAADGSTSSTTIHCTEADTENFNDPQYQEKLENLHYFNQLNGTWRNKSIGGCSRTIVYNGGCGLMSLYAGYYLFTGQGLNDNSFFDKFIRAAYNDGYYGCDSTYFSKFGENLEKLTNMNLTKFWEGSVTHGGYTDSLWDEIVSDLEKGHKLLIAVRRVHGSVFTSGNHIMLIDHYDKEKNAVYLFDPSINSNKISKSGTEKATDNIENGVYITRNIMKNYVIPWSIASLSYSAE